MKRIRKISYLKLISKFFSILSIVIMVSFLIFVLHTAITVLIQKFVSLTETEFDYVTPIIASIIDVIIVTLSGCTNLRNKFVHLYFNIEYIIYRVINHNLKTPYAINLFLYNFGFNKFPPNVQQEMIIQQLYEYLVTNKNEFFYIKGNSNTGKTMAVIQYIEAGTESTERFRMIDGKTIYICKHNTDSQIKVFINSYLQKKYSDNIIIIDDVGEYSIEIQIKFIKMIVEPYISSQKCYAKLLIFIGNNESSVICNKFNEIKNIISMKQSNNMSYIFDDSLEKVHFFCNKYKIYDISIKKWLSYVFLNSKGETILYSLMEQNDIELFTFFICIIIVGRYDSVFSENDLKKLFFFFRGRESIVYNKYLKTLLAANIISYFPTTPKMLYFNHTINCFLWERFSTSKNYNDGIVYFYRNSTCVNNPTESWLRFVECYSIDSSIAFNMNKELFKRAFLCGNYKYLLENVMAIFKRNTNIIKLFYQELGYLNEKTGNRLKAIDYLNKFISSANSEFEIQQTELLLFEILHHDNQDLTQIHALSYSSNLFIKFQALYWIEHINIEKGIFSLETLHEIVRKYLSKSSEWKEYLNYYHVLRRMFSDLVRVYFLNGKIDLEQFNEIKLLMEKSDLKNYHSEYDVYYRQLFRAHYIHYDIVFQLGFYGYFKHKCETLLIENPDLSYFLNLGVMEYKRCEDEFKSYGDKAWHTTLIRKNELGIARDVQIVNIIHELEDTKNFFSISRNYIHIAFVDCIICKAKFVQYYMNNLDSKFDTIYTECMLLLNESQKYYNRFRNNYGIYRIGLIKCFLNFFNEIELENSEIVFRHQLESLKNDRYSRELEMINFILSKKKIKSDLIYRFFKYYPIVLQ